MCLLKAAFILGDFSMEVDTVARQPRFLRLNVKAVKLPLSFTAGQPVELLGAGIQ